MRLCVLGTVLFCSIATVHFARADPLSRSSTGNDWLAAGEDERKSFCEELVQANPTLGRVGVSRLVEMLNLALTKDNGVLRTSRLGEIATGITALLAARSDEENRLIGNWRAQSTQFVESEGYSLVNADGEVKISRGADGGLIADGTFSVTTRSLTGATAIMRGEIKAAAMQYVHIPHSPGIIDDASENRYRVSGTFTDAVPPLPGRNVTTGSFFFSNQGMLTLQPGSQGLAGGFDRIYFVKAQ